MKKIDITQNILDLYEEEQLSKLIDEVKEELKDGVPDELQSELSALLQKANESIPQQSNNVISFRPKKKTPVFNNLATVELLAAAGQSLGDWFSQPLNFGGAGFILDIRRVIGTDNEVDLYLKPNDSNPENMEKTLAAYKGQTIHIAVSNNGEQLLDANLYIDETGNAAEGTGYLAEQTDNAIMGKINVDIVIED